MISRIKNHDTDCVTSAITLTIPLIGLEIPLDKNACASHTRSLTANKAVTFASISRFTAPVVESLTVRLADPCVTEPVPLTVPVHAEGGNPVPVTAVEFVLRVSGPKPEFQ